MPIQRVLVTGATGRTGSLVLQKLRQQPALFDAVGFCRSQVKAQELFGSTQGFCFGDIARPSDLESALSGIQSLVILTSAVPQMKGVPQPGARPEFGFEPGGTPEEVDYIGQKHQIDAALGADVNHIVLVGSMGGTDESHMLNRIGNGNILVWKRRAEQYLIDSGIEREFTVGGEGIVRVSIGRKIGERGNSLTDQHWFG
jgi:nucleoside-diphosphate-sugar epimerase